MSDQEVKIILTLEGEDRNFDAQALGLDMDSSENDIIEAVSNACDEPLTDENDEVTFTVRKALNSNTIYVYPKPVVGGLDELRLICMSNEQTQEEYVIFTEEDEETVPDEEFLPFGCSITVKRKVDSEILPVEFPMNRLLKVVDY